MRIHAAAGGGQTVEVEPTRLPGWLARFADRHGGIAATEPGDVEIYVMGGDGTRATAAVPFPPLRKADRGPGAAPAEPVEALLAHVDGLGELAVILVRERAYCVGAVRAGAVVASSTDTRYVQSRTAAGGWSQQRYARRRDNQRRDSFRAAADAAVRVLGARPGRFGGLVVGGDKSAIRAVTADPRLAHLAALPQRTFTDISEPRRAVLDEIAQRCRSIEITVREPDATSGT